jgi:adenylylsulfate kinase
MTAQTRLTTGATVWLTGLPSAGKTTLATALAARLRAAGHPVEILDGDAVRPVLSPELGYSRADRDANVARIGWVAALLARHGVLVLASVVSPFAEARSGVRSRHQADATAFLEVHVATPVEVCADRDVKGLYEKAFKGEIKEFTGVTDPYEPPENAEIVVDTENESVEESAGKVLAYVESRVGVAA